MEDAKALHMVTKYRAMSYDELRRRAQVAAFRARGSWLGGKQNPSLVDAGFELEAGIDPDWEEIAAAADNFEERAQ